MIKVTETGLLLKGNLPSILSETACILRNVHKKRLISLDQSLAKFYIKKQSHWQIWMKRTWKRNLRRWKQKK